MRLIKLSIRYRVPSWNFCNIDGYTADGRFSKKHCRFCQKTCAGYRCLLYDTGLTADPDFVNKTAECINASASCKGTIDEPLFPPVDSKIVATEAIKLYKSTMADLIKQGYPRAMAESIAAQFVADNL